MPFRQESVRAGNAFKQCPIPFCARLALSSIGAQGFQLYWEYKIELGLKQKTAVGIANGCSAY